MSSHLPLVPQLVSPRQDPSGSQWRKWDLHIHTPASYKWDLKKYRECADQNERDELTRAVIDSINNSDVEVFAIMDYWTFDGYLEIKRFIQNNPGICTKTIFPGIEIRIEAPTDFRLNIHVLLSDLVTNQQIADFKSDLKIRVNKRNLSDEGLIDWAQNNIDPSKAKIHGFGNPKSLSEDDLLILGSETAEITVSSFEKALQSINRDSYVVILPYRTYGGFADLKWQTHPAATIDFMQIADIFETRNSHDIDLINGITTEKNKGYIQNFLSNLGGKGKPAISGSDAHHINQYGVYHSNKVTWIKADTTFRGLRQVLNEPRERCFIGDTPPDLIRVKSNPTKYIHSIEIGKKPDFNLENEIWFNSHIDLNHGLVAIIGNKGSGKSALLDVIGLLSGYNKEEFFSFLHKKRFRDPKKGKAKHFSATLLWKSGISESSSLDTISTGYSQNVRYIPQHFFEEICNDTEIRQDSKFNEELESVIFSHVDHHERLGYGDLKSLIVYKTEEINKSIANLNASLTIINSQIVDLENQLMPSYKEEQEEYLRKKREELAIHEQNKPITIEKPEDNSDISNEIDKLRLEQEQIKVNKTLLEDRRESLYRKITITQKIINEIDLFRSQYENFVRQINEHIDLIQKDINEVVEVKISKDVITSLQADTQLEIDTLGKEIEVIDLRIIQIDESIKVKKSKLEQTHQSYQKYLSDLTIWETRRLEIIGDQGTSNTISWYEERINEIDAVIPQKLQQRKDQRNIIISDIYHQKNKIKEVYMNLYHPVQKFIDEHPLVKDVYKLSFEVSLKVIPSFFDSFFQHIKRNAGGTFHGSEDGMQYLKDLVAQYDFDTEQDISNFINQIITSLEINQRSNQKVTNFAHQLRSTVVDFYNFIYGLSYIEPDYALTLDNKKLHQLSPGERGILLLIFYLLIDNNDCPLIIDQPEENIDNQSIYKLLVPCIKIAKNRRQILLVTHNPNLAVVCDAEQIIFAYMSKDSGNEIQYLCGSIENPGINPILVDVLEGTWPALSKRESMYHKT